MEFVLEELGVLPNFNQYEIVICTGKRRELWEDNLIKAITDFATVNKCKRLSIMARPGWEKVSKKWGWKKKHVQLGNGYKIMSFLEEDQDLQHHQHHKHNL